MIFNLEERKDLKKVEFTQKAVIEVLGYLKQLAEKEKERHEEWETGIDWKWEWQKVNSELKKAYQDKISFAVEQLEKVKWIVEDIQCACGDDYNISRDFLIEEIDNQIKQLKENCGEK
jgi:hypothetical protein